MRTLLGSAPAALIAASLAAVVAGLACDGKQAAAPAGTGGAPGVGGATGSSDAAGTGGATGSLDAGGVSDAPALPGVVVLDRTRINSHSKQPNFQRARAPFDLGPGPFAKVTLTVDLSSSCFPFTQWKDDVPPMGQNWPAKCDAFDRLFEVLLDAPTAMGERPGIELVRAITPFGGPLRFEADVTDVINGLPGAHTLEAHIDTWSDGAGKVTGSDAGWTVSVSLTAVKGPAPRSVLAVIPLYHDSQRLAKVEPVAFTAPAGTTNVRIEYRTTGHTLEAGPRDTACIGPAEEFCQRKHTLDLDGVAVDEFSPWKTDCTKLCTLVKAPGPSGAELSYCAENPCGALASVRAPRANWCPGSVSDARVIERALTPGEHKLGWNVDAVAAGGSWRASVVAIAYR